MSGLLSYFSYGFIWRALIGGVLISLCIALLGVNLVLRRFSMIGDGLSHVGFGAIALAAVCGLSQWELEFTLPVVIVAAVLILRMSEHSHTQGDAAIALLATGAVAVGSLLYNYSPQRNADICNSLFGSASVLTLTDKDLLLSLVLSAVVLALTMWLFKTLGGRSRKYYQAQQSALGKVNGEIQEIVEGLKVVKAFTHEEQAKAEFRALNNTYRDAAQKANYYSIMIMPVSNNLMNISYALTAALGGVLSVLNGFDLGGLVIYLNYSKQIGQPLNQISQQMATIFAAMAGAERVFDVMDTPPEPADVPHPHTAEQMQGEVELSHVTFGYTPDKVILKDISLLAHPGQKIAFVGSTGAGKTTITNLINRFYDIQEGSITIDGVSTREYPLAELRRHIAMVLQDTHLFTGTVMENIRYGRLDATDEEVIAAAKTASAHSFIMRLEHGYDTRLEGDGANLSQGQRQLLNIARAALSKAPILVLDEATSSVDTRTERHIEHGMDRLMQNRTTFVIAHRLSTVRNADAILVLEQGQIVERGSHETLLAQKGRYYELYTGLRELD